MNKAHELTVAELAKVRAAGIDLKSKYVPASLRPAVTKILSNQSDRSEKKLDDVLAEVIKESKDPFKKVKAVHIQADSPEEIIAEVTKHISQEMISKVEAEAFERGKLAAFIQIDRILDEAALSGKLDQAVKMLKVIAGKSDDED